MIHRLRDLAQVRAACGDDDLLVWVAQDLRGPARAWALGEAVVAAAPQVSRHDRLAVWGDPADAAVLVRHALAELGPTYRPFGERDLLRRLTLDVDGLKEGGAFSWMTLRETPARLPQDVAWLAVDDEPQVSALLAADAPSSYAVPGAPGVLRWAGTRVGTELVAVAAEAWPAPSVGFLAGVATSARLRGRGLAGRVCRWVSAQLVARYGRAALMVDDDNTAAIKVYERIGYRRRLVLACRVDPRVDAGQVNAR